MKVDPATDAMNVNLADLLANQPDGPLVMVVSGAPAASVACGPMESASTSASRPITTRGQCLGRERNGGRARHPVAGASSDIAQPLLSVGSQSHATARGTRSIAEPREPGGRSSDTPANHP